MNYQQALDYLNSLCGMKLGLDDMTKAAQVLGNPQKKYKIIHVAGTNGKGSVCAMISSVLIKAGFKVGLFTSPHLINVNERFKINDEEISNKDFSQLVAKVKEVANNLTYYEFVTLVAFEYFASQKVDYALIEVGLGGRLDATNIVKADVAVLTGIGLEHTNLLGNTVKKIAMEKAGIIKKGSVVVSGVKGVAGEVIKKVCEENKSRLLDIVTVNHNTNLMGKFQKHNLNIAVSVALELGIRESAIIEGLNNVRLNGRMQFIKHNLLLDCAHNPDGIIALVNELKELPYRKLILVIGVLSDKDFKSMLSNIVPVCDKIILVKPDTNRALDPNLMVVNKDSVIIENVGEAVNHAMEIAQKNDLVLVTGSMYLVGEVLKLQSE